VLVRSARIAVVAGFALACERAAEPPPLANAPDAAPAAAAYVGAQRCAACHAREAALWRGSHHDLAMQEASAASVLGDFGGVRFSHSGVTSTFFSKDGRFFVNTDGPDGALADFEIAYTFGVAPLQQYLVRLPGGRLHALSIAWDTRPASAGGQRWFHLYPDERVPAGDVLHWTALSQRWNTQCAECHSTDLHKGFDAQRDAYETRFAEIDVACEACHGPGSRHAAWAEAGARAGGDPGLGVRLGDAGEATRARWVFDAGQAIARRERALPASAELEVCAPCHARRSTLREGRLPGQKLLDTHRPALLEPGLYEADGQMRDEVYVWGSFLQSRMYAAGVTCSDCHDPHSLAPRAEGDRLCAQCHRPEVFAVEAHHRHRAGSRGAACVACHLPARSYMQIDVRHDHSFRVPRPDLSVAIGTPNACTDCHADRPAAWAADALARWFVGGRSGTPHYGVALDAGRRGRPDAARALADLAQDAAQPALVRATALSLLDARAAAGAGDALRRGLADPDPLVRLGALEGARSLAPGERLAAALPALGDAQLALRVEAARALADVPAPHWRPAERARLAAALAEYRAALALDADRPEAHASLALLALAQGDPDAARSAYQTALRIAPWFVPAYVNLADLERQLGRDEAGEPWLRRAIEVAPELAEPHHALGLWLIRAGRRDEAVAELARAAALAPENARFALVHALALDDRGDREAAIAVLEAALARQRGDPELAAALAELRARPRRRRRAAAPCPSRPARPRVRAATRRTSRSPPRAGRGACRAGAARG
jgi:tetratricopeptide (TPR) repeat protein